MIEEIEGRAAVALIERGLTLYKSKWLIFRIFFFFEEEEFLCSVELFDECFVHEQEEEEEEEEEEDFFKF